ncbi:hypothetical protein JCM9140_1386 [Halalkalibacter wakoensis JCM 9140]|uniref:Tail specific protease domain-containing protein n=1 Tax=Halalkalibacter wakoensis JCM 9140 TaxID=1236970 RepID=W4Q1Z6_9BACI|nr:S41 family peptidase [Halalkalibacter wakoensis]GAE25394.1 hypothetical protein JCM9140_1386 [Halalkalibacter wakoensis JCM 9140]
MGKRFGWVFVLFLLIGGCSNTPTVELEEEAVHLLEALSKENRFYKEHSFHETNHLYDYSLSADEELTDEIVEQLRISNTKTPELTKETMIEDVEILHLALKHMYALYEYMGGDEAFEKARDNVINDLNEVDDETSLSLQSFIDLLKKHYRFVQDTHFYIDNAPLVQSEHTFYYSERFYFIHDEDGAFRLAENEQVKLVDINGDRNLESYLNYSLHDDGTIVLIPSIFSTELKAEESVWEVTLQEDGLLKTETITLEPMPNEIPRHQFGDLFSVTEKEGVPWVQLRSMFAYEGAMYDYDDIIHTANELNKEPFFVLDIRGNEGGSMILVEKWLKEFFGQSINWSAQSIYLFSNTSRTFVEDTINLYQSIGISAQTFEDDFTDLFRMKALKEYMEPHWEIEENVYEEVNDNRTHIFILVDHNTASAAEHLVAKLKLANKTTVVGGNTRGSIISGNSLMWQLPHSQIQMFTPTFFNYNPDLLEKETVGIQPDLWVTATRVESRLLSFIEQYREE